MIMTQHNGHTHTHTHTQTSKSLAVMNISSKASRSFGCPAAKGSEFSVEGSVVPPSTPTVLELAVEAPPTTNEGAGSKPPDDKSLRNKKQCVCVCVSVCVCVRRTYSQHRERPP